MKPTKILYKGIILVIGIIVHQLIVAQAPQKMSYQAVIRNSNNELVINSNIGIQISIFKGPLTGTAVYVERHFPYTNANGLISIEIGEGTIVSGTFVSINWANGPYFIMTEIDLNGGANYTITGTSQILSVPYALHAKTAESIYETITETDPIFTSSQAVKITATDITKLSNLSGINSGDQDLSSLVTKTALGDSIVQLRSEVPDVSEFLTSETDPTFVAWDKNYNDLINQPALWDSSYVSIKGKPDLTVYATKNMANRNITNLANPVNAQDAATKAYVDALRALLYISVDSAGLSKLISAGVSVSDLLTAGVSILDLFRIGFGVGTLEQNGVTSQELTDAGLIGTLSDIDGNNYKWVKIGNQIWMAENLKTTHYADGTAIPLVNSNASWNGLAETGQAYCWYNDDSTSNAQIYGALYTWAASMKGSASSTANPSGIQGICPIGWHLPSNAEWTTLKDYLASTNRNAGDLKEIGTLQGGDGLWYKSNYNFGATNETGFAALPGGDRYMNGVFSHISKSGHWWSSTEDTERYAYYLVIYYESNYASNTLFRKKLGNSIRCVKD